MSWELIGLITHQETFAEGSKIRELHRLVETYGGKSWKKRKGYGSIRLDSGEICAAELHWYEAHGVGKVELKIKELL
jgi:CRISPR/Cas system CSM-associated protein Csm3 (group 7 of RAMP superfamily)